MSSVHRQKGRPFYFCSYTTPDGDRHFVTTKQTNKQAAEVTCHEIEAQAIKAANEKLSPEKAREIVTNAVDRFRDVILLQVRKTFKNTTGDVMPLNSIQNWCERWIISKQVSMKKRSATRYKGETDRLLKLLGSKEAKKELSTLETSKISELRDLVAVKHSAGTANMFLKTLRACFNDAIAQRLITINPAASLKRLKFTRKIKKRKFTDEELGKILKASEDTEWYGMILCSIYLGGARLGDVASLKCANVDLKNGEVLFTPKKTEESSEIVQGLPIHPTLKDYLFKLLKNKKPDDPLFPECYEAGQKTTGTLSNRFYDRVLVKAGIVTKRSHAKQKQGKEAPREIKSVGFHSLRYNATSMLKECGVSNSLAMEIVGHETKAMSQIYTDIDFSVVKTAMAKMPDVTTQKSISSK